MILIHFRDRIERKFSVQKMFINKEALFRYRLLVISILLEQMQGITIKYLFLPKILKHKLFPFELIKGVEETETAVGHEAKIASHIQERS